MAPNFVTLAAVSAALLVAGPTLAQESGAKPASDETKSANAKLLSELPFDNTQEFEDAKAGFIAPLPDNGVIKNAKGEPIYDLSKFTNFIAEGKDAPDTVNPSLWRQSQLLLKGSLFKTAEGIYQVRAADLSNVTFIEAPEGIIVVDPLVSEETAKYTLDLYYAHRPKPVVAVIYGHSHVDHYGGVRGVVSEDDVKSGKVKIFAPQGFLDAAVAEYVMAGNAMSRRASYMYGNLLPQSPTGQVGAGLGPTTSFGTVTLIPPTDIIKEDGEKRKIGGLDFEFWMAPGSEAPSEMFFYIPSMKALCTAEDATHTLHNTYSLRGAKIRDPLAWSKYLNEVIYKWGDELEVLYAPQVNDRQRAHRRAPPQEPARPLPLYQRSAAAAYQSRVHHGRDTRDAEPAEVVTAGLVGSWLLRQRQPRYEIHVRALSRLVQRKSRDVARAS